MLEIVEGEAIGTPGCTRAGVRVSGFFVRELASMGWARGINPSVSRVYAAGATEEGRALRPRSCALRMLV